MGQKRNPFRVFINPHVQMRFGLFVGFLVGSSLCVVWASIEMMLLIFMRRYALDAAVLERLQDIHFYVIYFFFWEGLLAIGAGVFMTFIISRRVVGPLYRIQEELSQFLTHKKDDIAEFRVRTKDEFQDLSQTVNRFIEAFKRIHAELNEKKRG